MQCRLEGRIIRELRADPNRIRAAYADTIPDTWARDDEKLFPVNLNHLTDEGLQFLEGATTTRIVLSRINALRRAQENPESRIESLKLIPALVKARWENAEHKWLFEQNPDGTVRAWFIQRSDYDAPNLKAGIPAQADLELRAIGFRETEKRTLRWDAERIAKKTLGDLLSEAGLMEWDEELMAQYRASDKRWRSLMDKTGVQMLATGDAEMIYFSKSRYGSDPDALEEHVKPVSCSMDGTPTKIVLDPQSPELKKKERYAIVDKFWSDEKEGEDLKPMPIPRHHDLVGFNLFHHNYVQVHINNLTEYEWNDQVKDSLVIPDDDKRLILLLVKSVGKRMDDIVAGKSGGIIVLASGFPGVGKTLTAEVVSELLHRVLYNVQCSQLGITPDEIERRLLLTLARAQRWGAIMLIDESDVYIRARGKDIEQNAIVGVFLRVLEYFNGILFLATNRAATVDDAILSRCTAHVRYDLPTMPSLRKITADQIRLLGIELKKPVIDYLLSKYKALSGRDIRSIMKMAKLVSEAEESPIDEAMIDFCVKYQDVTKAS